MPVETHESSEQVKRAIGTPYGCRDRVFRDDYTLWVREYDADGLHYRMVETFIPHTMSTECRYDHSLTDPRCTTCTYKGSGEAYDLLVRARGG